MESIVSFVLEIDRLKAVTRKVRPLGLSRYENPAEHSWQIALMAYALSAHSATPVDIHRTIMMLLVHDIGEIDTGDTMAFVEGGWEQRKRDERAAVERIFSALSPQMASELVGLWEEFEAGETAEARFANAMDRAMPVLLNLANGGQSWRENGITYERVIGRVRDQIQSGCPSLWAYLDARLSEARRLELFGSA